MVLFNSDVKTRGISIAASFPPYEALEWSQIRDLTLMNVYLDLKKEETF